MNGGQRNPDELGGAAQKRSRADCLFLAALAGILVVFFWRVLVSGDVLYFRDFGLFFYPKRYLAAEAARHFQILHWEGLTGAGAPFLGTYQVAFFYPLSLIYYILPMPRSLMIFMVAHFFITGAGTYYLLRVWGARRAAAAVGALMWALAPAFVSIIDNVSFMTSLAWLPWCLAFAGKLMDEGRYRWFAGLAGAFAMSILAGAPEPVVFIGAFVAALVAWRLAAAIRARRGGAASKRALATAAALTTAALISGVELGPFIYLLKNSGRGEGLEVKMAGLWSMAPWNVLGWFLPRFYMTPGANGMYWSDQAWLKSLYMGAAVPMLAVWAIVAGARRKTLFFAGVAAVFVVFALGTWSPVWRFAYTSVPGFSLVRYPVKFYLPVAFACAVLAGFAMDDLLDRAERKEGRRLAALAIASAAFGLLLLAIWQMLGWWPEWFRSHFLPTTLAGQGSKRDELVLLQYAATKWSFARSGIVLLAAAFALWVVRGLQGRPVAAAVLGSVLVADIFLFSPYLNPVTGARSYTDVPRHVEAVEKGPGAGRLYTAPPLVAWRDSARIMDFSGLTGYMRYLTELKGPEYASADALVGWAREATGEPIADVNALSEYLARRDTGLLADIAQFEFYRETFYPNLHLLYGVRSQTAYDVLEPRWSTGLRKKLDTPTYDGGVRGERLYAASSVVDVTRMSPHFEYRKAEEGRPRAVLTSSVEESPSDETTLDMITADGFDPAKTVVLLAADAADARRFLGGATDAGGAGSVRWLVDGDNSEALEVNAPQPTLLYVADAYYPAFRAKVDGRPARLYRANYAFRAVEVPAGTHRVEMAYYPADFYAGLAATILGLAVLASAGVITRRYRGTPGGAR